MGLPELTTPRLRLRQFRFSDWPWLRELLVDDGIRERTLQPALSPKIAWFEAVMKAALTQHTWAIEETSTRTPVGWILLSKLDPAPHRAPGFEVRRQFWNRGYATEALAEVIRFTFLATQEPFLSGLVFVDNRPSQRVFEKSGFALKGTCECGGRECVEYELSAEVWRERVVEQQKAAMMSYLAPRVPRP